MNGVQLFGTNHTEVVTILRELPLRVRLVCGRKKSKRATSRFINLVDEHATVQSKVNIFWLRLIYSSRA